MLRAIVAIVAIVALNAAAAANAEPFAGPVAVRVVEVLDGDTFLADALIWPGQTLRVNIRIRGIDAPELKSRCGAEREAATLAKAALGRIIADRTVAIGNIGGAKYYGRVLADVTLAGGVDLASLLIRDRHARPYDGGKRLGWCAGSVSAGSAASP